MIQFIVGLVAGIFFTLFCIGLWALIEDEKNDKK